MNSNPKLAALVSAAILLGSSANALADDDSRFYARSDRARYDYAQVISAQPIIDYVTVTTPVRECWEETQVYRVDRHSNNGGGTLLGAIIGGVIGHQFGSGHGRDAATVAGVIIGAGIGSDAARHGDRNRYGSERHERQVERCETRYREHREERIDGYRVTYRYNGQKYVTEMPYDPGNRLRVRVDIRPAR